MSRARDFDAMRAQARARVVRNIKRLGWHVTGVFPSPADDARYCTFFVYTAGLWKSWHHPELITFGLKPEVAHGVFARCIELIKAGRMFADGEQVDEIVSGYSVHFRSAPNDHQHWPMNVTSVYYGHTDYPALQIVLPDVEGRWPWELLCDPKMAASQQQLVENH